MKEFIDHYKLVSLIGADALKSSIQWLQATKNSRMIYTPFGYSSFLPEKVIGFIGQLNEPEHGNYLPGVGYRMYSSTLQRFTVSDSFSPFSLGGLNSYAYCEADPVNNRDDNGHFSIGFVKRFMSLAPKRISKISLKRGVYSKISRTTPNGIPISKEMRKYAAAMAERPGYVNDWIPPSLLNRPLPAIPPNHLPFGKLRNPYAMEKSANLRPRHIYHTRSGIRRIKNVPVLEVKFPSQSRYRLRLDQKLDSIPE